MDGLTVLFIIGNLIGICILFSMKKSEFKELHPGKKFMGLF